MLRGFLPFRAGLCAGLCACVAAFGLGACNSVTTAPVTRANVDIPPTAAAGDPRTRAYYAGLQNEQLQSGRLRKDQGLNIRYDRLDLVNDFTNIALASEYDPAFGSMSGRSQSLPLNRWPGPVRINLEHGPSVDTTQRAKNQQWVSNYSQKLKRATRHPVSMAKTGGNFHVLVMTEAERKAAGPRIQQLAPGISRASLNALTSPRRTHLCLVVTLSPGGAGIMNAIAMVPAELPDLLRHSCFQEEIAQGLGLPNDSPTARPSLFNDDKEFAFLTQHDEYLLRILYDPRLKLGMNAAQARPIVDRIAWDMKPR